MRAPRRAAAALVLAVAALGAAARADDPPADPAATGLYADKPPSFWVGELRSPRTRAIAEGALALLGNAATTDVAGALSDADAKVRQSAARLLRDGKTDLAAVVPQLTAALADTDRGVVRFALGALRRAGPAAAPAAGEIAKKLDDGSHDVRNDALRALAVLGEAARPVVPSIATLLADSKCRSTALAAVTQLGTVAEAALASVLAAEPAADAKSRKAFLDALAGIAPLDERVHQCLRTHAASKDAKLRAAAVTALGACATAGADAVVPDLGAALTDTESAVRAAAAAAVRTLGKRAEPILPAIRTALAHPDGNIAAAAMEALAAADGLGTAVPELVRAIAAHGWPKLRAALERLGAEAAPALASIATGDGNPDERTVALLHLAKLPAEAVAPHAAAIREIAAGSSEKANVRCAALQALAAAQCADGRLLFGALASSDDSVREVVRRLVSQDPRIGSLVVEALRGEGTLRLTTLTFLQSFPVPEVHAEVEPLLADADPRVRLAAARALTLGGGGFFDGTTNASLALAAVVAEALAGSDPDALGWAAGQVFQLGANAGPAIPLLVSHALRPDSPISVHALQALGFLGQTGMPARDAALAALHGALTSEDRRVRIAVLRTLMVAADADSCTPERIADAFRAQGQAEVAELAMLVQFAPSQAAAFARPPVVDLLRAKLAAPEDPVAAQAVHALIVAAAAGASARDAVLAVWSGTDDRLRRAVAIRCLLLPQDGERICGEALGHADAEMRRAALTCIHETGRAPPALRARVKELTTDADRNIADTAKAALQRFPAPPQ